MPDFIRGFPEDSEAKGASQNQGKTKWHLIKLLWQFLFGLALVISQTLYSTGWKRGLCLQKQSSSRFVSTLLNASWLETKLLIMTGVPSALLFSSCLSGGGDEQVPLPGWRLVSLNLFCVRCSLLCFFHFFFPIPLYLLLSMALISQNIHKDSPQIVPWQSMLARSAKGKDLGGEGREIMLWKKISKHIIDRFWFLKNKWRKE